MLTLEEIGDASAPLVAPDIHPHLTRAIDID
jgi:hypothetical protein